MRELSLGLVDAKEVMRVWLKEISVGLINGIALGCLIALVAFLWKGNPYLGAVVGIESVAEPIWYWSVQSVPQRISQPPAA